MSLSGGLLANVLPSSKMIVDEKIKNDIILFIEKINQDKPNLTSLGIKEAGFDEMIALLETVFLKG